MSLYELSIDPAVVAQAEAALALEKRGFPTLVMRWESTIFGQSWTTTIVLDYAIALPPLMLGQATFNEVRIAAFTGGAPSKFFYFGVDLGPGAPRVACEMENVIGPGDDWQEFRVDQQSCPIPYLKLISATPRIYGNGAQDYYSPTIRVERYDAVPTPDLVADMFPHYVANLEPVRGSDLFEGGLWAGSRYVGITKIAVLRAGVPVGLHVRAARVEKDQPPPEIAKRNPKPDLVPQVVAIDVGTYSTVVAARAAQGGTEFVRVGPTQPATLAIHFESPTELHFGHLGRALKAWRERVISPLTRWGDVLVGHAARDLRAASASARGASLTGLPLLRKRIEAKHAIALRGAEDPSTVEALKKPAPPVIDEDGIGAYDPFDPFEVYSYYLGLHVNHRSRGLFTRYHVTMPTGWSPELRQSVLVTLRRGLFRSLPAGLVEFDDLAGLEVVDAGPSALAVAAHAVRAFHIQAKSDPVVLGVLDVGASEAGVLFGQLRPSRGAEKEQGLVTVFEHLEPAAVEDLGGERLLGRLALYACAKAEPTLAEANVRIDAGLEPHTQLSAPLASAGLVDSGPEARANAATLRDWLRPLLETGDASKLSPTVTLCAEGGEPKTLSLGVEPSELLAELDRLLAAGVHALAAVVSDHVSRLGKDPNPFDGVRIVLGGRGGLSAKLHDLLRAALPQGVTFHRYREPDKNNLHAPTAKSAAALGVLAMMADKLAGIPRAEKRGPFRFRVGRPKHGQLQDALTPSTDYDLWMESGASNKPVLELLFMRADDDGEVAADDPRVTRVACELGEGAIGQRLYLRAVGPHRIEVSVGPPGEQPSPDAPCVAVDLKTTEVERLRD
jgi:hypothetical protein